MCFSLVCALDPKASFRGTYIFFVGYSVFLAKTYGFAYSYHFNFLSFLFCLFPFPKESWQLKALIFLRCLIFFKIGLIDTILISTSESIEVQQKKNTVYNLFWWILRG